MWQSAAKPLLQDPSRASRLAVGLVPANHRDPGAGRRLGRRALRYPRPYAAVERATRQTQVPGDWIFAIMRQESLFRSDAVSRADARGLMQMQPATAAAVARRWHLPPPARQSLFDPSVAVQARGHVHSRIVGQVQGADRSELSRHTTRARCRWRAGCRAAPWMRISGSRTSRTTKPGLRAAHPRAHRGLRGHRDADAAAAVGVVAEGRPPSPPSP